MNQRDNSNIIELVFCPQKGHNCGKQRDLINEHLAVAQNCLHSKDYYIALNNLLKAHDAANEVSQQQCHKCKVLFKSIISSTCKFYVNDLKNMSKGLFRKRKYLLDYEYAKNVKKTLEGN